MLASGNMAKEVCAANLVKTVRGEVPYVRMKGVDSRWIDAPITEEYKARADVKWVIETYEPRVKSFETSIEPYDPMNGHLGVNLTIT